MLLSNISTLEISPIYSIDSLLKHIPWCINCLHRGLDVHGCKRERNADSNALWCLRFPCIVLTVSEWMTLHHSLPSLKDNWTVNRLALRATDCTGSMAAFPVLASYSGHSSRDHWLGPSKRHPARLIAHSKLTAQTSYPFTQRPGLYADLPWSWPVMIN